MNQLLMSGHDSYTSPPLNFKNDFLLLTVFRSFVVCYVPIHVCREYCKVDYVKSGKLD